MKPSERWHGWIPGQASVLVLKEKKKNSEATVFIAADLILWGGPNFDWLGLYCEQLRGSYHTL